MTPRPMAEHPSPADHRAVSQQLGREPRGVLAVGHRCECGLPDVVVTTPKLPDGSPFPTLFYLTCSRLTSAVSTLEAEGVMAEMQQRLAADEELARRYRVAHESYLHRREAIAHVEEVEGISAGGMPDRVKCLHVLVAHALAEGPGVNPFGDEALAMIRDRGVLRTAPCVELAEAST